MINCEDVTNKNIDIHNLNYPQIPNHLYKILIIGGSGSGTINTLLNLIKQLDNDDYSIIYLYVKGRNEAKYQYLIKKH